MACTIKGITDDVASEDRAQTERNVRKVAKLSETDKALAMNTPIAFLTEIINKVNPTYNGKKVHLLDLKRSKEGVFTMKYKLGSSPTVLVTEIGAFADFMTESGDRFRLDSGHLERLYSDHESLNNNDNFDVLALNITNNPEKIMEVAESLVELDEYHNDETHNGALRDRLHQISGALVEMMPNLNIHINNAGSANFGKIDVATKDVFITRGVGGSKSLLEVYVHELYHAVTHFAISSKDVAMRGATARIEKIRNNLLKNTKESDLVRKSGGTLTIEQASKILDHLSDPEVGLHEFVALSMTNKAVMNQLKSLNINDKGDNANQPLFYKLLDAVTQVFNTIASIITKEPKDDDLARMVFLVAKLHSTNKKPLEAKRLLGIRNLISVFEPAEKIFREYVAKLDKKVKDNPGDNVRRKGEGKFKHSVRLLARSLFDQTAADILGNVVSTFPLLSPEGTIRMMLRDMRDGDVTQEKVDGLTMASGVVDQQREFTAVHTERTVMSSMTRKLSEEEETLLTELVLDTDLSSIFYTYDMKTLLSSQGSINKEITRIVKELEAIVTPSDVNFYKAQTDLLANYMLNHEDNIALLKNADNIAKKIGTPNESLNVQPRVVRLIDEMATLKALKGISKEKKQAFRDFTEEQTLGVEHLVAFQLGQKDFAEKTLFQTPSDKLKIIKGYSAQLTDPNIDMATAPVANEKEMKAQGYKLIKQLEKHTLDKNDAVMGLYVSNTFMRQRFHRVGMRMTEMARRGTSVTESYGLWGGANSSVKAANDIRKMRDRKRVVDQAMMRGDYNPADVPDDGMVSPVLNNFGAVKDFTYGLDKDLKISELGMERKVGIVMGRTAASTYDKKETETFNKKILDLIEEDAAKNNKNAHKIGRNNKEYIKIEKNSTNAEVADVWKILPNNVKSRHPEGFIIRRDLMYSYLGYRELSITDMPGIKQLIGLNPEVFGKIIKFSLQVAEQLWKEIVKISKIDIIIRTPGVFIGNVISNFILMYVSGYSFKEITTLKLQGVRELKVYVDGLKRTIELETKQGAGLITKTEERELNTIKNNLKNSPVKDLVDEGFYTTIIEEVEHGEGSGSYFNKLAKKKLSRVPKIFSDGVDLLYITENTKLFKLMEKGIQASDFAARYAQYHLMVDKGTKKEDAVKIVRDNFINYNKPNSRFLEWANQMGFVMFTKYFTRIQRVLARHGKTDPMKVLLSILAQDYVFGELDTADDQSIFVKDMGNLFYNPFDNLMRVITPSSLELVDWIVNGKG